MAGNNVKIEKFVLDYFKCVNNDSDMNKTDQMYDILMNCFYYSGNNIMDKEMIKFYFTDEQLVAIKTKQKELGYEDNLSRFIRYVLFDFYMKKHEVMITSKGLIGKPIDIDKFISLIDKCEEELVNGKYTSYDLDLLRNNEKYKDDISFYTFENKICEVDFNVDFLEYDMLTFIRDSFLDNKVYFELVGLSTEQYASKDFLEIENGNNLKPFIDYDNIVPNIDSFYYLFLYKAFSINPGDLNIDKIFDETEEHINFLLEKYTFVKIIKYYKQRYDIVDFNKIFDKECIESLLSDNIITIEDIIKSDETTELDETIKSNEDINM